MINKLISQIWVGDKPMPAHFREWCAEWKALHPGWDYHLWGADAMERYGSDSYVRFLLETEAKTAFVADRIRALILLDFGGIYLDVDCQPVRPFRSIQHILDDPEVDFIAGMRSPDRKFVALHRGISLVDNTVLLSAKGGRMISRICSLYRPGAEKHSGYSMGLEVLRHLDNSTRLLGYKYFYAEQSFSETICLHDGHNLGSWSNRIVGHPGIRQESP